MQFLLLLTNLAYVYLVNFFDLSMLALSQITWYTAMSIITLRYGNMIVGNLEGILAGTMVDLDV